MKKEESTYKFWKTLRRCLVGCWFVAAVTLLVACQNDEVPSVRDNADSSEPITFVVNEEPWQQSQLNITRGTLLDDLKESSVGFGIFWADEHLKMNNLQVKWSGDRWDCPSRGLGTFLWPKSLTASKIYAYAPYVSAGSGTMGITNVGTDNSVTFATNNKGNTEVDLLWAESTLQPKTEISLTFHHALSKLSFGTITNNSGHDVVLTKITLKGKNNGLYTSGVLSLAGGTWSNLSGNAEESIDSSPNISINGNAEEKTKDIKTYETPIEWLLIPDQTVTVTLDFTYDGDALSAAFDVSLKAAKHTTVNITINTNFEVVITE